MTITWRPASPGDAFAIIPIQDNTELPYAVAKVGKGFEAWKRDTNPRGGYWGGQMLGIYETYPEAMARCMQEIQAPPPSGEDVAASSQDAT